jgi:hypothetical protein
MQMKPILVAKWRIDEDPMADQPSSVKWSDGAPAEYEDYLENVSGTHSWLPDEDGIELLMFPDVVADVSFDAVARTWIIRGVGPRTFALDVTDPVASDDQIVAALHLRRIVYKARIHR